MSSRLRDEAPMTPVEGGVVGHPILPAAPEDVCPGSIEDALGTGVPLAAGAQLGAAALGPSVGSPGVPTRGLHRTAGHGDRTEAGSGQGVDDRAVATFDGDPAHAVLGPVASRHALVRRSSLNSPWRSSGIRARRWTNGHQRCTAGLTVKGTWMVDQ